MTPQTAVDALRLMYTSRAIDDECGRLLKLGINVPNYHSGRGQEAVSVGVGLALRQDDYLLYTYRDFGALLAKGVSLEKLAADLLLKTQGTTEGFGGIMHVVDPDVGIVGRNGVFGSRFGIAIGLAVSSVYDEDNRVVLCSFGEAEGGRGPLYEALNMACLRHLPVVFLAENNGFSISSRTADIYAGGNMSDLWRGFPLPVCSCDGNDLRTVFGAVSGAVAHVRSGVGPAFVECVTYRVDPHIPADDDSAYRSAEEVRGWSARDPIGRWHGIVVAKGWMSQQEVEEMRAESAAAVRHAFDLALEAPEPAVEQIRECVYY